MAAGLPRRRCWCWCWPRGRGWMPGWFGQRKNANVSLHPSACPRAPSPPPHGQKSQHAGLGGSYRAVGSQVRPPPAASWRLGTFSVSPPPPKCVAQRRFHHLLHLTPATLLTEGGVNPMRLWLERRAPSAENPNLYL